MSTQPHDLKDLEKNNSEKNSEKKDKAETSATTPNRYRQKLMQNPVYSEELSWYTAFRRGDPFRVHLQKDYLLTPKEKRTPLFTLFPSQKRTGKDIIYSIDNELYALEYADGKVKEIHSAVKKEGDTRYHKLTLGVLTKDLQIIHYSLSYNEKAVVVRNAGAGRHVSNKIGEELTDIPGLKVGDKFIPQPEKGLKDPIDVLIAYFQAKGFTPSRTPSTLSALAKGETYEFLKRGGIRCYRMESVDPVDQYRYLSTGEICPRPVVPNLLSSAFTPRYDREREVTNSVTNTLSEMSVSSQNVSMDTNTASTTTGSTDSNSSTDSSTTRTSMMSMSSTGPK